MCRKAEGMKTQSDFDETGDVVLALEKVKRARCGKSLGVTLVSFCFNTVSLRLLFLFSVFFPFQSLTRFLGFFLFYVSTMDDIPYLLLAHQSRVIVFVSQFTAKRYK